jgi:hypothetical protein
VFGRRRRGVAPVGRHQNPVVHGCPFGRRRYKDGDRSR